MHSSLKDAMITSLQDRFWCRQRSVRNVVTA